MTLAMTGQTALVITWAIVAFLGIAGAVVVLVWAVRRRQFSGQDRARYLPLEDGPPGPGGKEHDDVSH